jgi:Zn-dependent peptidase ImmA (M78 family)
MERSADYQKAGSAAIQLLSKHRIDSPPVDLEKIADGEGLRIAVAEFKEHDISGFINLEQQLILVNKYDSPTRQRFTIAHELGHWVLHPQELKDNKDIVILYRKTLEEESDPLEQEANCFAANLLVPNSFLEGLLAASLPDKLIANVLQVSESVIGFRRKIFHAK